MWSLYYFSLCLPRNIKLCQYNLCSLQRLINILLSFSYSMCFNLSWTHSGLESGKAAVKRAKHGDNVISDGLALFSSYLKFTGESFISHCLFVFIFSFITVIINHFGENSFKI
uniref:Uncharacterized protein n=1 Tax=Rhizophora mucronata TaxID=61149 RepID=A0A2P2JDT0_RHIMU